MFKHFKQNKIMGYEIKYFAHFDTARNETVLRMRTKNVQGVYFLVSMKKVSSFQYRFYYPPTKSEGYSFGVVRASVHSVRPSTLFVCPEPYLSTYWSDLIHSWYK